MSFYHHSQLLDYRSPFGAVCCGTRVRLAMDAIGEHEAEIVLRVHCPEEGTQVVRGEKSPVSQGVRWSFDLDISDRPGLIWYDFEIHRAGQLRWYSAPEDGLGGEGYVSVRPSRAWQITVYEAGHVPAWPSEGIMYQIYVDRFFNGNPDGRIGPVPEGGLVHAHWDDTPFYVRDEKKRVVRWDFFGGNLKGVEAKLDELAAMGVDILYLNPIFSSPSNHKYDTADYRHVDAMYGGDEALASLMKAVKQRGMRLILDGVFSHTGSDSIYFNREGRYDSEGAYQSPTSPYSSWYRFDPWPNKYDCWWGVDTMPNVNELDPGYMAFQLTDGDSTVRRWMRYGIDGFRLDVADEIPDEFLACLRQVVREENPDALVLGEVWEDASNKISYDKRRQYFMGRELDSVTNYPLRDALIELILGKRTPREMVRLMKSLQENYPRDQFYSLMNMTGTHDTSRLMTILGEAPEASGMTESERERYRLSPEQRKMARRRMEMYAALLLTHPGLATIYYGDEAGMEGYADPFNRGPYPWGREDPEVKAAFFRLCRLRKSEPLLNRGAYEPISTESGLYGHWRWQGGDVLLTVINPRGQAVSGQIGCIGSGKMEVLWKMTGHSAYQLSEDRVEFHMRAQDYMIIRMRAALEENNGEGQA